MPKRNIDNAEYVRVRIARAKADGDHRTAMVLEELLSDNARLRTQLADICGKLSPDDVIGYLENFTTCDGCSLDLIGFADRPAALLCEDCAGADKRELDRLKKADRLVTALEDDKLASNVRSALDLSQFDSPATMMTKALAAYRASLRSILVRIHVPGPGLPANTAQAKGDKAK